MRPKRQSALGEVDASWGRRRGRRSPRRPARPGWARPTTWRTRRHSSACQRGVVGERRCRRRRGRRRRPSRGPWPGGARRSGRRGRRGGGRRRSGGRASTSVSSAPPRWPASTPSHGSPRLASTTSSSGQARRSGRHGSVSGSTPVTAARARWTRRPGKGKSRLAQTPSARPGEVPRRAARRCDEPPLDAAGVHGDDLRGEGVGRRRRRGARPGRRRARRPARPGAARTSRPLLHEVERIGQL